MASGSSADAFLGTQGDPWDTQEDMETALFGSIVAQLFFSRWHDRLIAGLPPQCANPRIGDPLEERKSQAATAS